MTAILSYALISLTEVKESLGINVGTYDNLLTRLINSATEQIENYCNRRFTETVYTEIYSGDGNQFLFLRNAPVTALTKIEFMTGDYDDPAWDAYESEFYNIDTTYTGGSTMSNDNSGVVYNRVSFYKGFNNIRVSYVAGYSTIPSDVSESCVDLVSYLYKAKNSKGIKSESLGDRSVTYDTGATVKSAFDSLGLDDVLAQYRIVEV